MSVFYPHNQPSLKTKYQRKSDKYRRDRARYLIKARTTRTQLRRIRRNTDRQPSHVVSKGGLPALVYLVRIVIGKNKTMRMYFIHPFYFMGERYGHKNGSNALNTNCPKIIICMDDAFDKGKDRSAEEKGCIQVQRWFRQDPIPFVGGVCISISSMVVEGNGVSPRYCCIFRSWSWRFGCF